MLSLINAYHWITPLIIILGCILVILWPRLHPDKPRDTIREIGDFTVALLTILAVTLVYAISVVMTHRL